MHNFTIKHQLSYRTLDQARRLISSPSFHQNIARKLSGSNLKIHSSSLINNIYIMKREVNLDVNIPDIAKKFLRGAFKIWRSEEWAIDTLTGKSYIRMNMPSELRCRSEIVEESGKIVANQVWEIDVQIPLISGILAKHAESEIRRFSKIEVEVINKEILNLYLL